MILPPLYPAKNGYILGFHQTENGRALASVRLRKAIHVEDSPETLRTAEQIEGDLRAAEDQEVQNLLAELAGKGYQVSIFRMSPSWCQGYCDTWPLDERLSLADIRDSWGGARFSLRILRPNGTYVTSRNIIIDGAPLRWGQPISQQQIHRERVESEFHPPPVAPPPDDTLKTIVTLMMDQNRAQTAFLTELLGSKQQQIDPLSSFNQTAQMIGMLRDLAQDFQPQGEGDGIGLAKMFFEELNSRKQVVAEAGRSLPPRRFAPPPRKRAPAPPPPGASPTSSTEGGGERPRPNPEPRGEPGERPPIRPVDGEEDEDGPTIAEELAEAGPEETAEVIREVFEAWTPDQQRTAIRSLLGGEIPPNMDMGGFLNDETTTEDEESEDFDEGTAARSLAAAPGGAASGRSSGEDQADN